MHVVKIFIDSQLQGGLLMWVIFIVGIIASYIGIDKFMFLRSFSVARKKFLKNVDTLILEQGTGKKTDNEEYDILLAQVRHCVVNKHECCKGFFREFLICTVPVLERHFSTMNAWISVAPLLGLLGTVMGMVQTFKVIMNFGVGNPALTAEGISVALLTTQAGLTVAFPVMLFHNYLSNKKTALLNQILKDFEELSKKISKKLTMD